MPIPMLIRSVLGIVGAAVLATACGDDEAPATDGSFAVGTRTIELLDETRPTPAFGDSPEKPSRTVVTDVWYPAEGQADGDAKPDARPADGPFPLVVFGHGQQGAPRMYAPSFERWVRAGYVVAAPRHPITIQGGPGGQFVDDVEGELGDVPFVMSMVANKLPDLVDDDRVAVAGHSSGALAALAVGFGKCCHDERVDAVLLEGLPDVEFDGEQPAAGQGTPVMFIHGTNDGTLPHAKVAFESAAPPKFLYLVKGGDHSAMYRDGTQAAEVADAALAFFNYALKDRDRALERLQTIPGVRAELG